LFANHGEGSLEVVFPCFTGGPEDWECLG
jgi:hypothetical protein